jgi:hypothetical protein
MEEVKNVKALGINNSGRLVVANQKHVSKLMII